MANELGRFLIFRADTGGANDERLRRQISPLATRLARFNRENEVGVAAPLRGASATRRGGGVGEAFFLSVDGVPLREPTLPAVRTLATSDRPMIGVRAGQFDAGGVGDSVLMGPNGKSMSVLSDPIAHSHKGQTLPAFHPQGLLLDSLGELPQPQVAPEEFEPPIIDLHDPREVGEGPLGDRLPPIPGIGEIERPISAPELPFFPIPRGPGWKWGHTEGLGGSTSIPLGAPGDTEAIIAVNCAWRQKFSTRFTRQGVNCFVEKSFLIPGATEPTAGDIMAEMARNGLSGGLDYWKRSFSKLMPRSMADTLQTIVYLLVSYRYRCPADCPTMTVRLLGFDFNAELSEVEIAVAGIRTKYVRDRGGRYFREGFIVTIRFTFTFTISGDVYYEAECIQRL